MKRLYFDYAATTPISRNVEKAMKPFALSGLSGVFGNPSSLHTFGQEALRALDEARTVASRALELSPDRTREIIFTGGATEANNMALRGTVVAFRSTNPSVRPKIIISAIEHESVFETAKDIEREGCADIAVIPVDERGIINLIHLKRELNEDTALVSVMYVNNEMGTVQPISEISRIINNFKNKNTKSSGAYPLLHCDAVQAFQYFDCNPDILGVDILTLSAHKMYGPKGTGILYLKNGQKAVTAVLTGGNQEFGMRSGTENVTGIVGCARAMEDAKNEREKQVKKIRGIKRKMFRSIREVYPRTETNGEMTEAGSPHILNVWLPGIPNELLLIQLDKEGVAVSAGSACHARAPQPSRVISEMYGIERAKESIRFSFGRYTKSGDVGIFTEKFREIIQRYRA